MGTDLRHTPLTAWHAANGARMVPFADFSMPVQYAAGIQAEVKIVRERAGLFDLCHMGRLELSGPDRIRAADHVLSQNVADKVPEGAIRYALICTPQGTVIDDVLVYKDPDRIHVVINASGREADPAWFQEHIGGFDATLQDCSDDQTMLAVQGPLAKDVLPKVCDIDLPALKYYRFGRARVCGDIDTIVSRTGYTGEDGFELFFALDQAQRVWDALLAAGAEPCGLGARDVCRTEAGMPLYGHEMNREITGLEAGLGFGIDLKKDFIGADALRRQREEGVPRALVGLGVDGRRVPREGCEVLHGGEVVGIVTSGTYSPTLERPIAMALVRTDLARAGVDFEVALRGKTIEARAEGMPFYSRKRKKKAPGT